MITFTPQISLARLAVQNAHIFREESEVRERNRLVHSHTAGQWQMGL